jgi:hypothetical protein
MTAARFGGTMTMRAFTVPTRITTATRRTSAMMAGIKSVSAMDSPGSE